MDGSRGRAVALFGLLVLSVAPCYLFCGAMPFVRGEGEILLKSTACSVLAAPFLAALGALGTQRRPWAYRVAFIGFGVVTGVYAVLFSHGLSTGEFSFPALLLLVVSAGEILCLERLRAGGEEREADAA